MHISIELDARHLLAAAVIVAASVLVAVWWVSPARSAVAGPDPVDDFAFVARADNPVDALAASSVAGQLGAPVFLTFPSSLGGQAADGLAAADPQVVVLAGGTVALSEQVEADIGELLPDADIRRMAGIDRTETARLVNELTGQLGVDRPVLAGATVAGDVGIDGTLTVDDTDVGAKIAALEARVEQLETLLAGAARDGDTLVLSGMNVQVVNGTGDTYTTNGLGNLIVGYNEDHTDSGCVPSPDNCQDIGDGSADDRTGSHNLIAGVDHTYSSHSGLLTGANNTISANFASVIGGTGNTASGPGASVTGGVRNTASGRSASVTGGVSNTASNAQASVTGGQNNTASGFVSSVTGGSSNTASGTRASVSGGRLNTASESRASVSGGLENTASGFRASILGGNGQTVSTTDGCHPSC